MKKPSGQTPAQQKLEQRQLAELERLESIETGKKLAAGRRTRGRASLISGSERGIGGDPAFAAKNLATKERLGVEEAARATEAADIAGKKREKRRLSLLESPVGYVETAEGYKIR